MKSIPSVTIAQMREVDRIMVEEIGMSVPMMMENASRNIAILCKKLLGGSVENKHIVILAGKGNNGGDGLGAARHLINFGATCKVFMMSTAESLNPNARIQHNILKQMTVEVNEAGSFSESHLISHLEFADLIIDALLGYNLKGAPREPIATFIYLANDCKKPILAVDIPSGLNGDTGIASKPTIKANTTLTLALPKAGMLTKKAKKYIGRLYLADISVPSVVYKRLGIDVKNLFVEDESVKIF